MGRNTCSLQVEEGPNYAKDETEKQIYIEHDNEFFTHQLCFCLFLHCWFTTYLSKVFKAHCFGTNSGQSTI